MKFTQSADGTLRTNLRIKFRFTEEEIERMKALAREAGVPLRKWICESAYDGIYNRLNCVDDQ